MSDTQSLSRDPVRKIVIVGGGAAGWMAAAALARLIERTGICVVLVESDALDELAVGEASIPSIRMFNGLLELHESDFARQTQATFNLGTEFVDWYCRGRSYIQPFGLYGFHFDAGLYADCLRRYSVSRGVSWIADKVVEVRRRPTDGFISSLVLHSGRSLEGELFLDCSGVRGLLIAQGLNVGFEDWSHWLPCDRVVATSSEKLGRLKPYTRATADMAGWRWRIPLQHRTSNGYVYCSEFIGDVVAHARLRAQLDSAALGDVRRLRFKSGHRHRFWEKNCVAIGPSGGFVEPLGPTCVHLIHTGLTKLLALFPDRTFSPVTINTYNDCMAYQYRRIRDHAILHYKATDRRETPFWRRCREMRIPESLQERIECFRANGTVTKDSEDPFKQVSWMAAMLGQGITPVTWDRQGVSLQSQNLRNLVNRDRSRFPAS